MEVHGIKSVMKTIGAMETSAEAKALETAGKIYQLEEARRKIEREDYLSAYEMIAKEGREYDGICNR